MFRAVVSAVSALALTIIPVAAQAAPIAAPRTASPVGESNELVGTTAWILAGIGAALLIWGIIELTDDDEPDSP